ncbi:hypothetical protein [Synechocystis sp. LKSZ1]|uniref:hypothetical protein n=1 Tax=Synechocystis sp. LKSZ1 TaxID=3144951 RepID=UPI00336C20A8
MPDFQTFITILTALLVFLLGIFLKYDTLYLRNYQIHFPQWAGLLLAGATFSLVVLDQLLRGFVRLEEIQRRDEETQRREQENRRKDEEARRREREILRREEEEARQREEDIRRRDEKARRREQDAIRAKNERLETAERETRRTRIETRYRIAVIRYQLDPSNLHRRQLADLLALLQEYQDTL